MLNWNIDMLLLLSICKGFSCDGNLFRIDGGLFEILMLNCMEKTTVAIL